MTCHPLFEDVQPRRVCPHRTLSQPCQRRRRPGSDWRNPPERLQHFAPCDVSISHPAMSQLRTLRCLNFAPCDVPTSHPAKSQLRTLRSFGFAPCEVREALGGSSPSACGFRPRAPCIRVAQSGDDGFAFSPSFSLFSMLSPEFHHSSTRKERGQTRLLHLPNERRRQRVTTLSCAVSSGGVRPLARRCRLPRCLPRSASLTGAANCIRTDNQTNRCAIAASAFRPA